MCVIGDFPRRTPIPNLHALLLLLLETLQLQRSFGLLNEFLPFGPVSDAVLPICYFHPCFIALYIIHLFLGLPADLVSAGDHSYTFFTMLLSGTRCTCPNQANLCALM
jgi:hypothetical protein